MTEGGRADGRQTAADVAFFSCPLNSASAFAPVAVSLPPTAALHTLPCPARQFVRPEHLPLVVVAPGLFTVLMLSPVVQNAPHKKRQKMVPSSKINFLSS